MGSMERRSREKQKEVATTMSNEEDDPRVHKDQDDARQYRCFKKYEEIVKQVGRSINPPMHVGVGLIIYKNINSS